MLVSFFYLVKGCERDIWGTANRGSIEFCVASLEARRIQKSDRFPTDYLGGMFCVLWNEQAVPSSKDYRFVVHREFKFSRSDGVLFVDGVRMFIKNGARWESIWNNLEALENKNAIY